VFLEETTAAFGGRSLQRKTHAKHVDIFLLLVVRRRQFFLDDGFDFHIVGTVLLVQLDERLGQAACESVEISPDGCVLIRSYDVRLRSYDQLVLGVPLMGSCDDKVTLDTGDVVGELLCRKDTRSGDSE